ncbi:type III toxin-antitoxin system TenpIN family toxin [Roseburia inulinivorans]
MCTLDTDAFDYQVLNLTNQFYLDYPDPPYKEIVRKNNRPYNCLLLQSHYGYFICIPYRSHIKHKYSYKFKNSKRSKRTNSGLDYTKIVIIKDLNYLGAVDAIVDTDEYKETRDNINYIKKDVQEYVDDYIEYINETSDKYTQKSFKRAYGYSTLQYFHSQLDLTQK